MIVIKCKRVQSTNPDITKSTFTVYNKDGSVLLENATFDDVFKKENVIKLILNATSLPLRIVEN